MKTKKISELILIVLSIIVIYLLVRKNFNEILESIVNANFMWIFVAIILYFLYLLFQAIPFYYFAKIYDKNIKFSFFIYLMIVTNFFNGITPLATGGQPLQVYELHKKGMPTIDASNIVAQHTIVYEFAVVLWMIIAIIINLSLNLFEVNNALKYAAILGFILNVIFLGSLILISFSNSFNKKMINSIIDFLVKIRLVKNPKPIKEKWENTCNDFYNNSKILLKNKHLLISGIFFLLLAYAFYYAIPFCIIHALHIECNINIAITIIITCYVFLSSSYLPIPGATGGTEFSFIGYFKNFITDYKLNSLLIIWRFLTYYLPTIIGGIVFNINSIKHRKKEN